MFYYMKKNICKKCKEQVKRLKHRENELMELII